MFPLLQTSIKQYGLNPGSLTIEKELNPTSGHGDLHYKIQVDNQFYSARWMSNKRYETEAFIQVTDEVLTEQMRFCKFVRHSGIPFMKQVLTVKEEPFTVVNQADKEWRFVLFEWIEGEHLTHCTDSIANKMGAFARKMHNVSTKFETSVFPKQPHHKGYDHFSTLLRHHAESSGSSPSTNELLTSYFNEMEYHLKKARTDSYDYLVQSDLNPLNILWNENGDIIGVVDFESITYTDRVEGLAWLVKWYSRTHGLGSHEMSPTLAKTVLRGYGAEEWLSPNDFERLPSLLWLTGCLNWNFTAKAIELLKNKEDALLNEHLITYFKRGEILLSLL
ncbi:phosphotransferase enzyme family protein [Gorillibacterium sp. sgz500922]|uniref:phosphotransferase enzyme family protein n=1 Tax=Gorillibacterium sp. sgz500922 TaxID=3446694 RepID=UPI003F672860